MKREEISTAHAEPNILERHPQDEFRKICDSLWTVGHPATVMQFGDSFSEVVNRQRYICRIIVKSCRVRSILRSNVKSGSGFDTYDSAMNQQRSG